MTRRILVAGLGNVFLGDDAFGVVVAQRLHSRALPAGVDVADFGIRGIDLAYSLPDYDAAVLIDTTARGGAPGTLYVIEPEVGQAVRELEMHGLTPDRALGWLGNA